MGRMGEETWSRCWRRGTVPAARAIVFRSSLRRQVLIVSEFSEKGLSGVKWSLPRPAPTVTRLNCTLAFRLAFCKARTRGVTSQTCLRNLALL